jgi:hypothetical protein
MEKHLRPALTGSGVLALAVAAGCCIKVGWMRDMWPLPDTLMLYLFLGAVAAAIGASTLWIARSGELGAMAGGAITLSAFYGALAVALFVLARQGGSASVGAGAFLSALAAFMFAGVFLWARRYPICDTRPLPALARVSFALYGALLVGVGLAVLLHVPNSFPLPLSPTSSVLIRSFFLGAACYFFFGLARPSWGNAAGQMWAFLAYDVILIVPFLLQFSHVAPGHLASLIVNTLVLIYSGVLSVYYLLFYPATRVHLVPRARALSQRTADQSRGAVEIAPRWRSRRGDARAPVVDTRIPRSCSS